MIILRKKDHYTTTKDVLTIATTQNGKCRVECGYCQATSNFKYFIKLLRGTNNFDNGLLGIRQACHRRQESAHQAFKSSPVCLQDFHNIWTA